MTIEEKLKAKSTEAMVYGKIVKSDTSITMQKQTVIKLTDAIAICQQEIDETCKKQREIINDNIGGWKESMGFAIQHAIEQQEQEYREEYFLGREEAFKYAVRMHDEHFNAPSLKESEQ